MISVVVTSLLYHPCVHIPESVPLALGGAIEAHCLVSAWLASGSVSKGALLGGMIWSYSTRVSRLQALLVRLFHSISSEDQPAEHNHVALAARWLFPWPQRSGRGPSCIWGHKRANDIAGFKSRSFLIGCKMKDLLAARTAFRHGRMKCVCVCVCVRACVGLTCRKHRFSSQWSTNHRFDRFPDVTAAIASHAALHLAPVQSKIVVQVQL